MKRSVATIAAVAAAAAVALPAAPAHAAKPASFQAGLWPFSKLQLAAAHQQSTGAGVTIAVIDGPVDPTVPELQGQHVITRTKGFCQNPDGSNPGRGTGTGADHATAIATLLVGNGHGTVNGQGVSGIAPSATVRSYVTAHYDAKMNSSCITPGSYEAYTQSLAIKQAVADGAKIINMSFGSDSTHIDDVNFALGEAERAGVIVVVATNDHMTPGRVDGAGLTNGVINVNAVNSAGVLNRFSAGGNRVAVSAPGTSLTIGGFFPNWQSDGWGDGSSYAAPLVCGALALVWSKYPKARPNQIIQDLLNNTGLIVGKDAAGKPTYTNGFTRSANAPAGYQQGNGYGYGIVNPLAMLAADPNRYPDSNPLIRADGTPAPSALGAAPTSPAATSTAPTAVQSSAQPSAITSSDPAAAAASKSGGGSAGPAIGIGAAVLVVLLAGGGVLMARNRSRPQRAAGVGGSG